MKPNIEITVSKLAESMRPEYTELSASRIKCECGSTNYDLGYTCEKCGDRIIVCAECFHIACGCRCGHCDEGSIFSDELNYRLMKSGKLLVELGTAEELARRLRDCGKVSFSTKMDVERGVKELGGVAGTHEFWTTNYDRCELIAYPSNATNGADHSDRAD